MTNFLLGHFFITLQMGNINYDGKIYEFDWYRILILLIGTPIIALSIFYSHDWVWLHEISAKITIPIINLITGRENYVYYNEYKPLEPWVFQIISPEGLQYGAIGMETMCTGIQAIAIFVGVILMIPHNISKDFTYELPSEMQFLKKLGTWIKDIFNNNDNIWKRKFLAIFWTSVVFYIVNILRMVIQLSLYKGTNWDDLHYPISSASSFIAVACVLLVHKFVPEFIISLMWIGDEIKALISGTQKETTDNIAENDEKALEIDEKIEDPEHTKS